jgi:hypothetical protein
MERPVEVLPSGKLRNLSPKEIAKWRKRTKNNNLEARHPDDNQKWRTVIVGLPIIRKLLVGEDVELETLRINLIPDDVLFNARARKKKT